MSGTCGARPVLPALRTTSPCEIRADVKKRNGQRNWWCHTHGQAAGGPGGPLEICRGAAVGAVAQDDVLELDLADYPGGVSCWGATKPPISHGRVHPDVGVHVHARRKPGGKKDIDRSFVKVRITFAGETVELDEASCLAFLVTSIAGKQMVELICHWCGWTHLDRDDFAVKGHRKHLCNRCGRHFWHDTPTISNPAVGARRLWAGAVRSPKLATSALALRAADWSAFALWASNPAILWTGTDSERAGIHVHAWDHRGRLIIDETYGQVSMDGVSIDAGQFRVLMAQQVVIKEAWRLTSLTCPKCGAAHLDRDLDAFKPTAMKCCIYCGARFSTPGRRRLVSNPIVRVLSAISASSGLDPGFGMQPVTLSRDAEHDAKKGKEGRDG